MIRPIHGSAYVNRSLLGLLSCLPSVLIFAQTLAERLGYPAGTKLIIVHADDLGETHAVNAAAIKAFEAGRSTPRA